MHFYIDFRRCARILGILCKFFLGRKHICANSYTFRMSGPLLCDSSAIESFMHVCLSTALLIRDPMNNGYTHRILGEKGQKIGCCFSAFINFTLSD